MADPTEKGSFRTDIGQDVIDEALQSVDRQAPPEVTLEVETEAAPTGAEAGPALETAREELETLRAQLEFSQAKSREMMEKIKESHERALRAAADLDNFKKRAQKEREEVQRFGVEKLLKDMLPVMDNLDRALEVGQQPVELESLQKGVAMTRKLFEDALGRHGVKPFSAKGKAFDPRVHEAMQQVETTEVPAGQVAAEILRGYTLNDRLVRPALVAVAKPPAAPAPPPAEAASPEAPAASTATAPTVPGAAASAAAETESDEHHE